MSIKVYSCPCKQFTHVLGARVSTLITSGHSSICDMPGLCLYSSHCGGKLLYPAQNHVSHFHNSTVMTLRIYQLSTFFFFLFVFEGNLDLISHRRLWLWLVKGLSGCALNQCPQPLGCGPVPVRRLFGCLSTTTWRPLHENIVWCHTSSWGKTGWEPLH